MMPVAAVTLAVAFLAAPLLVEAQQGGKVYRVGYLSIAGERSPQATFRAAFLQGLGDLGYDQSRNLGVEYRFADGNAARLPGLAQELVGARVDVLLGEGIQASLALKEATTALPIVSLSCDAVAAGLVPSLAHPDSNVTGVSCITPDLAAKRLQLLKERAPTISRVGILWNIADLAEKAEVAAAQSAASALGIRAHRFAVQTAEDFPRAFDAMKRERVDGLFALGDSFTVLHRATIVSEAAAARLPAMYSFREFVEAGG